MTDSRSAASYAFKTFQAVKATKICKTFKTFKTNFGTIAIPDTKLAIDKFNSLSKAFETSMLLITGFTNAGDYNTAYELLKNVLAECEKALVFFAQMQAASAYIYTTKIATHLMDHLNLHLARTIRKSKETNESKSNDDRKESDPHALLSLFAALSEEQLHELYHMFLNGTGSPIARNLYFVTTINARAWIFLHSEVETEHHKLSNLVENEEHINAHIELFGINKITTQDHIPETMAEIRRSLDFLDKDIVPVVFKSFATALYNAAGKLKGNLKKSYYLAAKETAEIGMQHFAEMERIFRHFPKAMKQIKERLKSIIVNVSNKYEAKATPGDAKSTVSVATSKDTTFSAGRTQSKALEKYKQGCDEIKNGHFSDAVRSLEESVREFKEIIEPRVKALSALASAHQKNGCDGKAHKTLSDAFQICVENSDEVSDDIVQEILDELSKLEVVAAPASTPGIH